MRNLLFKLGNWLIGLSKKPIIILEVNTELMDKTRQYCMEAGNFASGTSGEYKRHVVYAKLIKTFPEIKKKNLALAIELVVN